MRRDLEEAVDAAATDTRQTLEALVTRLDDADLNTLGALGLTRQDRDVRIQEALGDAGTRLAEPRTCEFCGTALMDHSLDSTCGQPR